MGWDEASQDPKGWGWDKKIFPVMQGEMEMGQDKILWSGSKNLILRTLAPNSTFQNYNKQDISH